MTYPVGTGDYRIIYEIRDNELLVLVLRMGRCREVCRSAWAHPDRILTARLTTRNRIPPT